MSKYAPLTDALLKLPQSQVTLSFQQIESLIGARLPPSARKHRPWWSNNPGNNVMTRAWLDAGRITEDVDIAAERVTFTKPRTPNRHLAAVRASATPPQTVVASTAPTTTQQATSLQAIQPGPALSVSQLSARAQRYLAALENEGYNTSTLLIEIIETELARRIRQRMVDQLEADPLTQALPRFDSTTLVREVRDADFG